MIFLDRCSSYLPLQIFRNESMTFIQNHFFFFFLFLPLIINLRKINRNYSSYTYNFTTLYNLIFSISYRPN